MKKKELTSLKKLKMSNYLSGFLTFSKSNNLGDYIQSIAALELIGENYTNLDREELDVYKGDKINLLMNGWFMEKPNRWPPAANINPLIISFHLNPIAIKQMLSKAGIEYFKKHEPIGCRDSFTQNTLSKKGIKTYFSGCLTLTLKNNKIDNKKKGILILSALDRMNPKISKNNFFTQFFKFPKKYYDYIKSKRLLDNFISDQNPSKLTFKSQIIELTKHTVKEKFLMAREQLKMISESELVITSRIHTALPAISLGTKVIFLTDGLDHINQKSRLEGLSDYFFCCKTSDLRKLDINKISPKKSYKGISEALIEKTDQFFSRDD